MGHLRKRLFTATLKGELVQSLLPHPSIRTRPRPAGVSGIFQFLILRVRGRTRVQSRELPAQTVGYLIITVKPVTTSLAVKKSGFATVS